MSTSSGWPVSGSNCPVTDPKSLSDRSALAQPPTRPRLQDMPPLLQGIRCAFGRLEHTFCLATAGRCLATERGRWGLGEAGGWQVGGRWGLGEPARRSGEHPGAGAQGLGCNQPAQRVDRIRPVRATE